MDNKEKCSIREKVAKQYIKYIEKLDPLNTNDADKIEELLIKTNDILQYFYAVPTDIQNDDDRAIDEAISRLGAIVELIENETLMLKIRPCCNIDKEGKITMEVMDKMKKNPYYSMTPYEAINVISWFKGTFKETIGDKVYHHMDLKPDAAHTFNKALLVLNEILKADGYSVIKDEDTIREDKEQVIEQDIIPAAISFRTNIVKTKMLISIHPGDDKLDQEFNNIYNAFDKRESSYRIIFSLREFLKRLKFIYESKDFITNINLQDYHILFITGLDGGIQFIKDDFSVMIYTIDRT